MSASKYASKRFWIDTMDRAIASTAQGIIGSAALDSTGILDIDWAGVLSVGGSMGLLALLTSVAFRGKPEPAPERPAGGASPASIQED